MWRISFILHSMRKMVKIQPRSLHASKLHFQKVENSFTLFWMQITLTLENLTTATFHLSTFHY